MQKKIKIIYELSENGQRDAFIRNLDLQKYNSFICEYENWMKDLLEFTYENEPYISVCNVVHRYKVLETHVIKTEIEEIRGQIFDYAPTNEEIISWLKEQSISRGIKYQEALMKKQKINSKVDRKEKIGKIVDKILFTSLACVSISLLFTVIMGLINKKF